MGEFDVVTVEDIRLMQGLAQRVTAVRPDLVNSDATFGELAWIWGKGHTSDGGTWPSRLWSSGGELVAWGWAYLPHEVRRSDPDCRRLGLGSATLLHGMRLARDSGATHMTVACYGAPGLPAARGLYYGVGFRPFTRDVPLIKQAA
jgi:GNAT superfamily N-acetyltransferase